MGKKKGKKKNHKKKLEELAKTEEIQPKSRKRFWISAGIASFALAAFGLAAAYFGGCSKANSTQQTQNVKRISTYSFERMPPAWRPYFIEEGVLVSDEIMDKYTLYKTKNRPSPAEIAEESSREYEIFLKEPAPENFTDGVFSAFVYTSDLTDAIIGRNLLSEFFSSEPYLRLQEELRTNTPANDDDLSRRILNCAALMTFKKLTLLEEFTAQSAEFLRSLRAGTGDCFEYSLTISNLYCFLCHELKRDDLATKIRIVDGVVLHGDYKYIDAHKWIQHHYQGRWIDLEGNVVDNIGRDTPITLSIPVRYGCNAPEGVYMLPIMTTTAQFSNDTTITVEKRTYFLPEIEKEEAER